MFSKDVCELNVGMLWDLALKRGRAESWCWVWCPGAGFGALVLFLLLVPVTGAVPVLIVL